MVAVADSTKIIDNLNLILYDIELFLPGIETASDECFFLTYSGNNKSGYKYCIPDKKYRSNCSSHYVVQCTLNTTRVMLKMLMLYY